MKLPIFNNYLPDWVVPRLLFHTIFGLYIIEDLRLAPPLLGIGEEPTVRRGAIPK